MDGERIPFEAVDGEPLIARWYAAERPVGVVLLAGAFGVPQRYYRRFATHLATRGLSTLTVDYRGVGESRRGSLRGYRATLRQWGEDDLGGALDVVSERAAGAKLLWFAHSFGGQALGLAPLRGRVAGALTYGSQLGALQHWPKLRANLIKAQLHLGKPVMDAIGYCPGWLGIGEDVPLGVMSEWRRWCLSERYLLDHVPGAEAAFAAVDVPVHLMVAPDDHFAPVAAVNELAALFPRSTVSVVHGGDGHFGYFKAGHERLWDGAATLLQELGATRAAA